MLLRELPIYIELFKEEDKGWLGQFTLDAEEDLFLACCYKLLERARRFPDHQIALYNPDNDSIEGLINGEPVSDEFIQKIIRDPITFGRYIIVSGCYTFKISQEDIGNNRLCPSVVSKGKGGKRLIVGARDQAVAAGEKVYVFTRPDGYSDFEREYGDTIEKYVDLVVKGELDRREKIRFDALSLHSKIGSENRGVNFDIQMKNGAKASFSGDGFEVAAIVPESRSADLDSVGYCILGEHKVKTIAQESRETAAA